MNFIHTYNIWIDFRVLILKVDVIYAKVLTLSNFGYG
jgi:hypothetical protein